MIECLVVTAAEAAKMLKLNPEELGRRLDTGEIPAVRDGRNWKIPKTLLNVYLENRAIAEAKERRRIFEEKELNGKEDKH